MLAKCDENALKRNETKDNVNKVKDRSGWYFEFSARERKVRKTDQKASDLLSSGDANENVYTSKVFSRLVEIKYLKKREMKYTMEIIFI